MFVLGITGGIGCGKSAAADYFRARGARVLDADALSHEVTQAGGTALPDIVALFGAEALDEAGAMRRAFVAETVFQDRRLLDRLSAIVHRHVLERMAERIAAAEKEGLKFCVLDVPIPVKEGFLDRCDFVLVVRADEDLRLERLRARGMDEAEARRRMAMQMTEEEYAAKGQLLIDNSGTLEALHAELDAFAERELLSRGIRLGG